MIDMEKGSYVHQYIDGEVLLNLLKIVKNKEIDLAQENRKKRNSVKQCIHENQAGFCQQIIDTIKAMQTADVRPVVRGEWNVIASFDDCVYARCMNCKIVQVFYYNKPLTNFCSHCGADMKGLSN